MMACRHLQSCHDLQTHANMHLSEILKSLVAGTGHPHAIIRGFYLHHLQQAHVCCTTRALLQPTASLHHMHVLARL
jgi:hypothetical protein